MVITLTRTATPAELRAYFQTLSPMELESAKYQVPQMENFYQNANITDNMTASTKDFVGDDGVEYEDITFIVDARYTVKGDLWVSGGGFRINASQLLREIQEALDSL